MEYIFSPDDIRDKVLAFMREKDMYPARERDRWLILDDHIHRYQIECHKNGSTNGAYIIHTDGIPAAFIQDWGNTNAKFTWSMKGFKKSDLPDFDINKWNEQRAAREAEQHEKQAKAIDDAYEYYEKAFDGEIWHAYPNRKNVKAYDSVKLDNPTGHLLIPLRDVGGSFKAVQTIDRDGCPVILMADNDLATFNKSAKLITGYIAHPFDPANLEGSDWDDYALKFGNDAARKAIQQGKADMYREAKRRYYAEQVQQLGYMGGQDFATFCRTPEGANWLIQDWLTAENQLILLALSASDKGFLVLDIAASIACLHILTNTEMSFISSARGNAGNRKVYNMRDFGNLDADEQAQALMDMGIV